MGNKNRENAFIRFLIPLLILLTVIFIFKTGYKTGHWLYNILH